MKQNVIPTTSPITTTAMNPSSSAAAHHRTTTTAATAISFGRNSLAIFLLSTCALYILYSSNLIFLSQHQKQPCPSTNAANSAATISTTSLIDLPTNLSYPQYFDVEDDDEESSNNRHRPPPPSPPPPRRRAAGAAASTELKHIVFGIAASASLWEKRKEYIKTWWRRGETRGVVWLDKKVTVRRGENLPDVRISGDTSRFKYTNRQGRRAALRISRVVSETVRLKKSLVGPSNGEVRWFVMGDDDTVFVVENLVRVLSKYDHNQFYYVGSSSESHVQNIYFSYGMAYGGGGFAISYPLAKELEKMQDGCIQRYPGLYGSDDRMQACMAELGVPLTREPGFHQYDVYGDLLGLLGAHPVSPLLSLHHLDVVEPIFPKTSRAGSVQRLFRSGRHDTASLLQQSICYDKRRSWSVSVSWGYVVQVMRGVISPRELEMPARTFLNWYKRADYTAYAFNTRPLTKHPCQKPFVFYATGDARLDRAKNQIAASYSRHRARHPYCRWKMDSPERIDSIVVLKRPDPLRWQKSPRRDCCRVLPSTKKSTMYLWVGKCRGGEISQL